MRFGLSVPTVGAFADARAHAELAALAERNGWDGYFLWDAVAHKWRPVLDVWVGLTAIAVGTERIAFGPMVAAVPLYRTWQLIETVTNLAELSNGRLILGAGSSDAPEDELAARGEPPLRDRARALDLALETMRTAFAERGVKVPIWIGATDPAKKRAALRRAARYDGVFPIGLDRDPAEVDRIRRYVAKRRTTPFDLAVATTALKDGGADGVVDRYTSVGATWLVGGFDWNWTLERARSAILAGPLTGGRSRE